MGLTMKLSIQIFCIFLLSATVVTAESTKFLSSWKNPRGGLIDLSGKKVAAFVINADQSIRLGSEETLATEMRSRGVDCVAGYLVLPGELAKDTEKAKEFLNSTGVTTALLMRVVIENETRTVPPSVTYSSGYYPSFWGYWDYGWSTVYSTTYTSGYTRTDRVVSIETLLYSIEQDKLLWAGTSETVNPKDVRRFVKELISEAGKELRNAGLIR